MSRLKELFLNNIDLGLSVIPVKLQYKKKDDVYEGKCPAIANWQSFCNELPTIDNVDTWNLESSSGVGLCVGNASGLMCVDIDEKDEHIKERLLNALPNSPLGIIGNPKKGGKYLYKIPEGFNGKAIHTIKNTLGETSIEFFFDKKQVVLPPSIHTKKDNKIIHRYKWVNDSTAKFALNNLDDLPVFDINYILKAEEIIKGTQPQSQIDLNSPILKEDKISTGRYDDMKKTISGFFAKSLPIDRMLMELKKHDLERNSENPYFLDPTKGKQTDDYDLNILLYIASMAKSLEKDKINLNFMKEVATPGEEIWENIDLSVKEVDEDISINEVPKAAREFCQAMHELNNISIYGAYLILLTTLSPVVGNKRAIKPKALDSYYLHPNLYTVVCQPSGTRKTEVLSRARKFLGDVQKRADVNFKNKSLEISRKQEANSFFIKAKKDKLKRNLMRLNDLGNEAPDYIETENELLQDEISDLENKNTQPNEVIYEISGATYERTLQLIKSTETGNLIYFEEQQELLSTQQQKGNEKLRALILDGREGKQKKTALTKTQGNISIDKLTLSLLTATQPKLLAYHLKRAKNEPLSADGYFARNMYIFNDYDSRAAKDTPYNHENMHTIKNIFALAYEMEKKETPIPFSVEASEKWMELETLVKKQAIELDEDIRPLATKFANQVIAISYLDGLFRDQSDISQVNIISFEIAIKMFKMMFKHINAIIEYGTIELIKDFIKLIQEGTVFEDYKVSDLKKVMWELKSVGARTEFVRELKARRIIRVESNKISINPKVFSIKLNKKRQLF